jgi:hypothetical protein
MSHRRFKAVVVGLFVSLTNRASNWLPPPPPPQKTSTEGYIESCLEALDERFLNVDNMHLNPLHSSSLFCIRLDLNPQVFVAPDIPVFFIGAM